MILAFQTPSPARFVVFLVIEAAVSTLVFWHASRHRNPRATLWAVAAFFAPFLVAPMYFFNYWYKTQRR